MSGKPAGSSKHSTHWIGSKPWADEARRPGEIYDPATGQITGTVDFAGPAAVAAAAAASPDWREASLTRQADVMFRVPRAGDCAQRRADQLGTRRRTRLPWRLLLLRESERQIW